MPTATGHASCGLPRVETLPGHFPITPPASARVVGLDTWVWRRLARAFGGRGDAADKVALEALLGAVDERRIVVPLALTNYMEISGIQNYAIRREVALLASRLSGWFNYLSSAIVRRVEIDQALHRRFGRPLHPRRMPPLVGWGASYAHRGTSDRLGLIVQQGNTRQVVTTPPHLVSFLRSGDELMQSSLLAGASPEDEPELRERFGDAPEKTWGVAAERRDRERHVVAGLQEDPDLRDRVDDVIAAGHMAIELAPALAECLGRAGIPWEEFTAGGKDGFTAFMDQLPTAVCTQAVRKGIIHGRQREVEIRDVHDADLFSLIVPYSDLVVLEAASCDALTRAGVDRRYDTTLIKKMAQVSEAIDRLTTC